MISIIFCSIDNHKTKAMENQFLEILKDEPHEIIIIHDAKSLSEAYNRGLNAAIGDIVILCHDDVEFLDPDHWLTKVKTHLGSYDLIGLAGTTKLIGPSWAQAGPPNTFGQVAEVNADAEPYRVLLFNASSIVIPEIQAVDGLFMALNKRIASQLRFDEKTFDGFHCYDIDYSFSAYKSGFKLGVATDIPVLHGSQGKFDDSWKEYALRFNDKHKASLAIQRIRPFRHACVYAKNKDEIIEIMMGQNGLKKL